MVPSKTVAIGDPNTIWGKDKCYMNAIVFDEHDRKVLPAMTTKTFFVEYEEYALLLVEEGSRRVVAASKTGSRSELLELFKQQYPEATLADYVFKPGPLMLANGAAVAGSESGLGAGSGRQGQTR
jgi:hypothetical protein